MVQSYHSDMTSPLDVSRSRGGLPDWIGSRHKQLVFPSWLVSALLHGTLLLMFLWISQSRGCRSDYQGNEGEGFREVGVYLTSGDTEEEPTEESADEANPTPVEPAPKFELGPLLDAPPIELERPTEFSEPVLGIGWLPDALSGSTPTTSLETQPRSGVPASTPNVLGRSTSLFGVQDAGRRFVYVLDRSHSMDDYHAMRQAKAELMASLENLDATQEFQVIFYNNEPLLLTPPSDRSDMFRGIDTHRLQVERQLGTVQPIGGTTHFNALELAMKFNADVIFFLTDADEPGLTLGEMETIRLANNGAARIHCIEFGEGPDLKRPGDPRNFLQKLATESGGTYKYIDVKHLD